MRVRIALITAALAASVLASAAPANAVATVCYDVQVQANGQALVSQSGCQEV